MENAWITEVEAEGFVRYSYQVKESLLSKQTSFQKLEILDTLAYGRVMLLDGMMMLTDKDEFIYHELISHVPMALHPAAQDILIIGGGDGGTVRELLRYPEVNCILLCEIDGDVIEAAKRFFPKVAGGLSDPRVEVKVGDGIEFVRSHAGPGFDLVIIDSTDPVGPGEGLFNREFYADVARILKPDGLMCAQTESPWFPGAMLAKIHANLKANFKTVVPYVAPIPTYPRGLWSWTVASQTALPVTALKLRRSLDASALHYLNGQTIQAAFALPNFYRKKL